LAACFEGSRRYHRQQDRRAVDRSRSW
jgi:hypothetical protein